MHLSLRKGFPLFILASSVYWSLQHLISALTQGGNGSQFFRLTCSVVLSGGSNTANQYHWRVWEVLPGFRPPWVCPHSPRCVLSFYTSQALCCSARNYLRQALGCLHFPGKSCSGSGSRVLHKGADLVGPEFGALPTLSSVQSLSRVQLFATP